MTAISSVMEAVQLVNGSGDVLMSTRVPALVKWLTVAREPPTRNAANSAAGPTSPTARIARIAPAGIRMKVCKVSQPVSTPGVLSAKSTTHYINEAVNITSGAV